MQEIINFDDAQQLYSILPLQSPMHAISSCEQFAIVVGVCSWSHSSFCYSWNGLPAHIKHCSNNHISIFNSGLVDNL